MNTATAGPDGLKDISASDTAKVILTAPPSRWKGRVKGMVFTNAGRIIRQQLRTPIRALELVSISDTMFKLPEYWADDITMAIGSDIIDPSDYEFVAETGTLVFGGLPLRSQ